jgi:Leu/Phe-tRNA-protein transferase
VTTQNLDLIDPALLLLAYRGGVFPMADRVMTRKFSG